MSTTFENASVGDKVWSLYTGKWANYQQYQK
jgi:hypothetical protein